MGRRLHIWFFICFYYFFFMSNTMKTILFYFIQNWIGLPWKVFYLVLSTLVFLDFVFITSLFTLVTCWKTVTFFLPKSIYSWSFLLLMISSLWFTLLLGGSHIIFCSRSTKKNWHISSAVHSSRISWSFSSCYTVIHHINASHGC